MPVDEAGLEVQVTGRGDPVLVVQTALVADELAELSRHLAATHQVLHCHRRGYAGSRDISGPRSMADEAADCAALLRALAVAPVHLVGASFSAAVALTLAARSPDLVQTLAVVEPPPTGTPGAAEFRLANRDLLAVHDARGPVEALDQFMRQLVGEDWRETSERDLPGSVRAMERDAGTFFGSDIPALLSWRFDAADAARVRAPVLLVGGRETGPWFSEMRERLLRLLPASAEATIDGAGHLVASTHPAEVAAHLRRHFDKAGGRGTGPDGASLPA